MSARPLTLVTAVALAAAAGLAGCSSGGGEPGGGAATPATQDADGASRLAANHPADRSTLEQGGTLRLPMTDWPANFNAWHIGGNVSSYRDVVAATDPVLYDYAPDGTISPRTDFLLALPTVRTEGGRQVVTYRLNPKARWNDGTPIDHTAFAATWKANAAPTGRGPYQNVATAGYEDIAAVSRGATAHEVVVTFARPFHPVTEVFGSLLHPKVAASPETFNAGLRTDVHPEWRSGPFTVERVDPTNKSLVLVRNPSWWGARPLLDRVVFTQMDDSATIPAFRNGEIDATGVSTKARYAQIQGAPGLDLRRSQRTTTNVLVLNAKAEGLTDVRVRKALWQAVDREEWKRVRYAGLNWSEKPANSALYYSFQPEARDNVPVSFSVPEARRTLEAAGYTAGADGVYAKAGRPLSVTYTSFGDDPIQTALAQLLRTQVRKAGIDLRLDIRPKAAFGETIAKREYGIVAMGWSSGSPSPLVAVCQLYCSDSPSNASGAGTPDLDTTLRGLGAIADPAQQAAAINAAEKAWMAQTYGQLPISNGPVITATRAGLANWGPAMFASLTPRWENVGWTPGSAHG